MDIIKIVKDLRKLKTGLRLLLSDYQLKLLPYLHNKIQLASIFNNNTKVKIKNALKEDTLRKNLKKVLENKKKHINKKIINLIQGTKDYNSQHCNDFDIKSKDKHQDS